MLALMERKQHFSILRCSLFLFLVFTCFQVTQAQTYSPVKSIQSKGADISTDYLGNLYIIKEFRLSKYDMNGKPLSVYEDYSNGRITSVDVSDPMKIIVFYEDFMKVKVLDKTLSELALYDFNQSGYSSISALAHSRDDDFWIFDNTAFLLKKVDENGKALYKSEKFNMLFTETVQVRQIVDYEDYIYLNDPNNGIYVFDRFGTYQKRIPILGADKIQIIQGIIVYFQNETLYSYNTVDLREEQMNLPSWVHGSYGQLQKDRVYIVEADRISIYTFK